MRGGPARRLSRNWTRLQDLIAAGHHRHSARRDGRLPRRGLLLTDLGGLHIALRIARPSERARLDPLLWIPRALLGVLRCGRNALDATSVRALLL